MAINYSDPYTRGNPANRARSYDCRSTQTMTGVVRAVNPLYEIEAGALVYIFQLKTYVKCDVGIGHTSHNNIGEYTPLSVGDYVRVCFSDGISNNPVIIGTYPRQGSISAEVEEGTIPGPDSTINGHQINPRPINYYADGLAELNRTTLSVRRLEGTRSQSPVTGSGIAAEVPGTIYASSPLGDESVIVPGEYRLFASNIIQTINASSIEESDAVLAEAIQYRQLVEAQQSIFNAYPFDLTGPQLTFNEDYLLPTAQQGIFREALRAYDEFTQASMQRLEQAQETSIGLDDFVDNCLTSFADLVKGHWSTILGSVIDTALDKINDLLPEQLQLDIGYDPETGKFSTVGIGPLSFDPATGKVTVDDEDFSLVDSALSELNKRLPIFQQIQDLGGSISIGDILRGIGLDQIEEGGMTVDPQGRTVEIEGILYNLANKGIEELNSRLPADLQVEVGTNEETGELSSIKVGPLSLDLATGQTKFDPSALLKPAEQLLERLPPPFKVAARILSSIVDLPSLEEVLDGGIESISIRSTSGCAIAEQTLPILVRSLGSAIGIDLELPDLSEEPQTLSAAAAETPVKTLRDFTPTKPHRLVLPSNNLSFRDRPHEAVASLMTEYGVPNAGGIVRSLNNLYNDGTLFDLIDTIQYSGNTPLFTSILMLNSALGRDPSEQISRVKAYAPVTCSGASPISSQLRRLTSDQAIDFIETELGLPRPSLSQMLRDPLEFLSWAQSIDPQLEDAISRLIRADYVGFVIEVTKYKSGRPVDRHLNTKRLLESWASKAFSPSVLGATYNVA